MKFLLVFFMTCNGPFIFAQNVGIGITNPGRAKIEVVTALTESTPTKGLFAGTPGSGHSGTGISIQDYFPTIGFNQYRDQAGQESYIGNGYAAAQYLDPVNGGLNIDFYSYGGANTQTWGLKRVLTIHQSGNVTIGQVPDNTSALTVGKTSSASSSACFTGTTYNSYFNTGFGESTYIRAGIGGGTVYINDISNGKTSISGVVGINTANPVYPLELRQPAGDKGFCIVNPNTWHNWEFRVSGAEGQLQLYYDEVLRGRFYSDGEYHSVSDNRLKTNIHSLPVLLDKLMLLHPVEFELSDRNPLHKKNIGFIAQDVKKIFPELVSVSPDSSNGYKNINDLHTLNYSGFGTIAIKAIQEQQLIIQSLQKEIDELRKIVDALAGSSHIITTN